MPKEVNHPTEAHFQKRFGKLPELQSQSTWIKEHPRNWNKRLQEFDEVIEVINDMLTVPEAVSCDYHQDVLDLKERLEINELPSLSTMLDRIKIKEQPKSNESLLVTNAFNTIKKQLGDDGDWHWVTEITNPFQALSGLLIEGYGLALSYLYDGDPQVKRLFVKAFEEVLFTENKTLLEDKTRQRKEGKTHYKILDDVILWMVGEREDFPSKIAEEVMTDERYGRKFGNSRFLGDDPSILDESPEGLLKIFSWSQACPDPEAAVEVFGLDWIIRRYAECNFWTGWIKKQTEKINPSLAEMLNKPVKRPKNMTAGKYNKLYVPGSYEDEISPMSTIWGYALSRVLIEQFGRGDQRTQERVFKGLNIVDKVIKKSKTPAELLARLANEVVKADVKAEAVLGHVFAVEMEAEGKLFLLKEMVKEIKTHAPNLWKKYLSLGSNYKKNGVIAPDILLK